MLKFDSVSIGYHKVPLIKNLSVEIPTGSITTIVGPNGCGKTTLISVLNKSSQLFNGSITLDGEDIYHMNGHLRAQKIAFLPQIREVIPALPVHTLVEHGRFPYLGFRDASPKKTADWWKMPWNLPILRITVTLQLTLFPAE